MKIKPREYIVCDICKNEITESNLFGYRKIKVREWFYKWNKYDLCFECASALEKMVREKVRNREAE